MDIKKILRNYKLKKTLIKASEDRISLYETMIEKPEIIENYYTKSNVENVLPKTFSGNKSSIVEKTFDMRDSKIKEIKQLINKEKSDNFFLKQELNQIDKAMEALSEEEQYILECKYIENMLWAKVEFKFNERFREEDYITTSGIRKISNKAIEKINKIISPFYILYYN